MSGMILARRALSLVRLAGGEKRGIHRCSHPEDIGRYIERDMAPPLLALLVLLCVGPSRAQTTGSTLRCGSEAELLENLGFVRTACERAQGPETFADGDTLVPELITARACAEVVRRVAISCSTLLGRSPWFASQKLLLDEAVQMATALGEDGAGGLLGGAQNPFLMTAPDATAISQSSQVSYADQS